MNTEKDFTYSSVEAVCSDLKIVFITDDKSEAIDGTNVHMHSFFEMFYLQEGTLTVNSENEQYRIGKGQLMIMPPKTYHSTSFSDDAVKKSVLFTFCKVKTQEEEKLYDKVQAAFSKRGVTVISACEHILGVLGALLENSAIERDGAVFRARAYVTELTFMLYDRLSGGDDVSPQYPIEQNSYWAYKYAIDRLLDIYYSTDISLEFLSEKLYLSPQNITRIISSAYGKSFNELKQELKMRNAKKLLHDTQLSVAEIGEKIGYTSSRGFLSAFLKYEGCTPSEYRKKKYE